MLLAHAPPFEKQPRQQLVLHSILAKYTSSVHLPRIALKHWKAAMLVRLKFVCLLQQKSKKTDAFLFFTFSLSIACHNRRIEGAMSILSWNAAFAARAT